jgi:hypothetical protein
MLAGGYFFLYFKFLFLMANMQTIILTELVPYSFTELYVYLAKLNAQEFCIQLPRQEVEELPACFQVPGKSTFSDESHHYVMEYYDALYIGERLSALCNDLSYTVPLPKSPQPFSYEFSTTNLDLLADTLYLLGGAFPGMIPGTGSISIWRQRTGSGTVIVLMKYRLIASALYISWNKNWRKNKKAICIPLIPGSSLDTPKLLYTITWPCSPKRNGASLSPGDTGFRLTLMPIL